LVGWPVFVSQQHNSQEVDLFGLIDPEMRTYLLAVVLTRARISLDGCWIAVAVPEAAAGIGEILHSSEDAERPAGGLGLARGHDAEDPRVPCMRTVAMQQQRKAALLTAGGVGASLPRQQLSSQGLESYL
jgi:hypothetical protein